LMPRPIEYWTLVNEEAKDNESFIIIYTKSINQSSGG
jgi:hypothetical protein